MEEPAKKLLTDLPLDVLQHIVARIELAYHIGRAAPTCKVVSVAARNAIKARPFSSEVVTLNGHTHRVRSLTAAPDGRVITASHDMAIKVWRDGACECTIQGSEDDAAKLWPLDGAPERAFEVGDVVFCVAALPDGVHFVVGLDASLELYHVDGTLVHTFEGHTSVVYAVAVTPDGQHIISGSFDKLVKVWSVATKSIVSTCAGHTGSVDAVAAMPDGQRILSGGGMYDHTVRVWLLNGTHQNTFSELHTSWLNALVALPDNQHALSGSADSLNSDDTIKLFNVNDGAVLRTFKRQQTGYCVLCLALLPDGLRFVSGSACHTARIAYHGLAP